MTYKKDYFLIWHRQLITVFCHIKLENRNKIFFRLRENFNALLIRLEEIGDLRDTVVQEIGKIIQENRSLMGEISELKTEIRKLARDKAKRKRYGIYLVYMLKKINYFSLNLQVLQKDDVTVINSAKPHLLEYQ